MLPEMKKPGLVCVALSVPLILNSLSFRPSGCRRGYAKLIPSRKLFVF